MNSHYLPPLTNQRLPRLPHLYSYSSFPDLPQSIPPNILLCYPQFLCWIYSLKFSLLDCVGRVPGTFLDEGRDFSSASRDVGTRIVHFGEVRKCLHGFILKKCCATPTSLPSWYTFFVFAFDNIYCVIPFIMDGWKGHCCYCY